MVWEINCTLTWILKCCKKGPLNSYQTFHSNSTLHSLKSSQKLRECFIQIYLWHSIEKVIYLWSELNEISERPIAFPQKKKQKIQRTVVMRPLQSLTFQKRFPVYTKTPDLFEFPVVRFHCRQAERCLFQQSHFSLPRKRRMSWELCSTILINLSIYRDALFCKIVF